MSTYYPEQELYIHHLFPFYLQCEGGITSILQTRSSEKLYNLHKGIQLLSGREEFESISE